MNKLINRKNLVEMLKKAKIGRVNKKALNEIEEYVGEEIKNLADLLKELLTLRGKRTLTDKVVKEATKKFRENRKENYEV